MPCSPQGTTPAPSSRKSPSCVSAVTPTWWPILAATSGEAALSPCLPPGSPHVALLCAHPSSVPPLPPRNDRLWICMEFCGGGSLQEIYHGEYRDSRPQRATAFSQPALPQHGAGEKSWGPRLCPFSTPHWLCGPSSLLTGCVTLRETVSFSGLCIPGCAGRGCGQHLFHLAVPAAFPHKGWPGNVSLFSRPPCQPSPIPFQPPGPWRNGRLPMSAERH